MGEYQCEICSITGNQSLEGTKFVPHETATDMTSISNIEAAELIQIGWRSSVEEPAGGSGYGMNSFSLSESVTMYRAQASCNPELDNFGPSICGCSS